MSFETSVVWLKTISILLIVVGALFSWATFGGLAWLGLGFLDLAVWPIDGSQTYAAPETRLLAAITGGLTAELGAALLMVTTHIYANNPAVGRRMILSFVLTWFVVDSIGSVLAGAGFNTVINLALLVVIILPLLVAKPARQTATQ